VSTLSGDIAQLEAAFTAAGVTVPTAVPAAAAIYSAAVAEAAPPTINYGALTSGTVAAALRAAAATTAGNAYLAGMIDHLETTLRAAVAALSVDLSGIDTTTYGSPGYALRDLLRSRWNVAVTGV
jgi:hypothetical protein